MRIAVNTRVLLKGRMEGVARYIYHTTKEMVLAHPEDTFYFFFDRPFDESFIFAENVVPIHIGPPARHPILYIIWFEFSLYRALKKYKIDVLYSGDTFMSLLTKVPTLLVSHDLAYIHYPEHIPFSSRLYYKVFFPKFHRKAKRIISVSDATKQDIVKQYQIDPEKIKIAYNDTDGSFKPLTFEEQEKVRIESSFGKPYLLYLGSIHPRKNIANTIKAFDLFKQKQSSEHQLILVGRKAWNTEVIDQTYENAKFKKDIHFLGMISEGREKLMAAADALVYISFFEGFGVPILEAMDADTAVITANVSSMPEVAGNSALLVDPHSVDDIAKAMNDICFNEALKMELKISVEGQREKFNWARSAEIIYNQLENIQSKVS